MFIRLMQGGKIIIGYTWTLSKRQQCHDLELTECLKRRGLEEVLREFLFQIVFIEEQGRRRECRKNIKKKKQSPQEAHHKV